MLRQFLLLLLLVPGLVQAQMPTVQNVEDIHDLFRQHFAQRVDRGSGTGFKPWKRAEWFWGQRAFPTGTIPDGARWQAYQQMLKMPRAHTDEPWEELGPANIGGRTRVIRFHPNNPDIMFAGSVSGGLWKSTDAGHIWVPITDFLPNIAVGALEFDPLHPDTMYMGTGEGYYNVDAVLGIGLLKSTDGGDSWEQTSLSWPYSSSSAVNKISIDPTNPENIVVATRNGLRLSTDGFVTYSIPSGGGSGDFKDVQRDPQNPNNLLAAAGYPWGAASNGIYKSTDGGLTWSRRTSGLPSVMTMGRSILAYYQNNPAVVYCGVAATLNAGAHTIGIYRSGDGGDTWDVINNTVDIFSEQSWYDMMLAVYPENSALLFAAGRYMFRSTNSGYQWSQIGANVHVDYHECVFHPDDPSIVFVGTDGGIFMSFTGGDSWEERNTDYVTHQYYGFGNATIDTLCAFGGSQDNGTTRWLGSRDWDMVYGGDGGYCVIDWSNDMTVYVEWQFGHHLRSTNGGNTFQNIQNGIAGDGPWVTPVIQDPFESNTLYTTAGAGQIYITTNRGDLWEPLGSPLGAEVQSIAASPILQGRLYAARGSGIYRKDPGTTTWTSASGGLPSAEVTRVIPDIANPDGVYATISGFGASHVYWSNNAGDNWTNITGDLPRVPVQDLAIDLNDASTLYAGTDLGVFRTTDHGQSWEIFGSGFPVAVVDDLEMQARTGMLRAATHGRGLWQIPTGGPTVNFLYPNGGELLALGTTIEMRWAGESFGGDVAIELNRNYPGDNWETLHATTPNDGEESWTVTEPTTDHARFRISHLTLPNHSDTTNTDTRIVVPGLRLVSPNGGESVVVTSNYYIEFERTLVTDTLAIELNRDYPSGDWEEIDDVVIADTSLRWLVLGEPTESARMRVYSVTNPGFADTSDANFSIIQPSMAVLYPSGGEVLDDDSTVTLRWIAEDLEGRVQISLNRDYPTGAWESLFANTANDGEQNWAVTGPASQHCRLRVRAVIAPEVEAVSDGDFEIRALAAGATASLPTAFRLYPPAPNPFNPQTVILFDLPMTQRVKVEVFNRLGRRVSILADETRVPGTHRLVFDGSGLSSGIYFVRVQAGSESRIAKLVLVR
jgi:photosystem II stability/assembly factor-like uncharacterized protein